MAISSASRDRRAIPSSRFEPAEQLNDSRERLQTAERRKRVLWVDDDSEANAAVVASLGEAGFEVSQAPTLARGDALLKSATFDLLLLDLRLPDGWGLSLLSSRNRHEPIPTVIVSGYGNADDARDALRLGAIDFLRKPLLDEKELINSAQIAVGCGSRKAEPECSVEPVILVGAHTELQSMQLGPYIPGDDHGAQQVVSVVATLLGHPGLGLAAFVACSAALREIAQREDVTLRQAAQTAADCVESALLKRTQELPGDLRAALHFLHTAALLGQRPSESEITGRLCMPALSELLVRHTGSNLRFWRWAVAARLTAQRLVLTSEHIRQIAFQLGYTYVSQHEREFQYVLGLTPRAFRFACHSR